MGRHKAVWATDILFLWESFLLMALSVLLFPTSFIPCEMNSHEYQQFRRNISWNIVPFTLQSLVLTEVLHVSQRDQRIWP